jgi:hypothetical protein
MVQVGMNERTKTPCKPENVLGKIRFYRNQNQISFHNRQTKGTTQKERHCHHKLVNLK